MPVSRNRKGHAQKVKARNVRMASEKKKAQKEMQTLYEEMQKKQQELATTAEAVEQEVTNVVDDLGIDNVI